MSLPQIATTIAEARNAVRDAAARGKCVGFVPTMGALHEGHLSLVAASRVQCDFHIASIFVNPTQFGEGEDLERYPRTFDEDVKQLSECGVDLVFAPSAQEMYPDGYSTFIEPPEVARRLEGDFRPGHFRGVATVVLKLFNAIPADMAFFGEKDFQQCLVVQHMVRDLNLATKVVGCPIVREPDGLAMSSRNRYLNNVDRRRALGLSKALEAVENAVHDGTTDTTELEAMMTTQLSDCVDRVDYSVIVDSETLASVARVDRPVVALIAAHIGSTRLIDNRRLDIRQ